MSTVAAAGHRPGVGAVLRLAARDFYEESWRLVLLNTLLSAYVLAVLAAAAFVPAALVLLLGAGPLLAAIVAAAVTIVDTGSLTFLELSDGFRRSFRRGLVLGASLALGAIATVLALRLYGGAGPFAWPLAVLVLYLGAIFLLFQLLLWPLALRDPERPLREAASDAALALLDRPAATTAVGLALLVVNALGVAAAVLPFLTLTIAYSALVAARFALAPAEAREA
jgi:hypothetical protein